MITACAWHWTLLSFRLYVFEMKRKIAVEIIVEVLVGVYLMGIVVFLWGHPVAATFMLAALLFSEYYYDRQYKIVGAKRHLSSSVS